MDMQFGMLESPARDEILTNSEVSDLSDKGFPLTPINTLSDGEAVRPACEIWSRSWCLCFSMKVTRRIATSGWSFIVRSMCRRLFKVVRIKFPVL